VAECLRKVSKLALVDRIVLFGQQPDIVSETEQTAEQCFRFLEVTLEDEVIDMPKAAREKGAFTGWKTVNPRLGFVAQNKSVDQKPAFNLGDGIANAIIAGRQETDQPFIASASASDSSPKMSSWNCMAASLPMRTGAEPS
jgi:hypothetical protein